MTVRIAAVDLGASSGRVLAGVVGRDRLAIDEVRRFPNGPVRVAHADGSTLHWDVLGLYRETLLGIQEAGELSGVGIDSWGVDYGLLDHAGALLGNPVHHRDGRTDGVARRVADVVPPAELFAVTGLQRLPFNTLYQLLAEGDRLAAAETMLLIPDLLAYWLTGRIGAERTNASTTQLYDPRAGAWATGLAERVGLPPRLLPPLREPGERIGPLLPDLAAELAVPKLPELPVLAVGSHDTASAVAAVPAEPGSNFAYISSGTWSLVGVELDRPELGQGALAADFTNEVGVDGTIRFLRNVMGLWVLSETLRTWAAHDRLAALLAAAAEAPPLAAVVDIDAPEFLAPGDMPGRIGAACVRTGQRPPDDEAGLVRCILDSLALAYRRALRQAARLTGRPVDVVHVVGGGARNDLLCRLTADACGVPVLAGPVEATGLGNVLVQARTLGADLPDLAAMRALVRRTQPVRRYEPTPGADWSAAEARLPETPKSRE